MRAMIRYVFVVAVSLCSLALVSFAKPPESGSPAEKQPAKASSVNKADENQTAPVMSITEARERAKLAHNFYSATLDAMHRSYFNSATAPVPARVMERMFADVEAEENIKARWIAVNARAMSIDHEPKTEFEKKAAEEIAAGKGEYERVEQGVYQRAGAISLMNHGCLTCHHGFGKRNTKDRFAGLIISIPVTAKEKSNAGKK
ncbi:hypothetical protein Pan153_18910 [Gimesia panareensis]|uniref:Tll0287-like domain-containing protein n=1 Tax=Gimesia panareensis TaxID=2527978 RepID=A0A518FLL3_9PLAN|nr:DUF3365 domain-containing protein [Gimesia panareensis]QDV17256.1 hypothetical protein Pan153_18910 [Gimesia panareensis]